MKSILTLFLTISTLISFSQQNDSTPLKPARLETRHEVGFAAGYATGVGISYRYYPKRLGIQITTAPIISSDDVQFSLGTSLMYTLNETRITKFYLYYGNHIYINNQEYSDYYYTDDLYTQQAEQTYYDNSTGYTTGIGCGIELTAWQKVGFNFNFGLGYHYEENNYNGVFTTYWNTTIIGGGGIFYKFK